MRQTANQLVFFYFVMAALVAVTVVGQESQPTASQAADGKPAAISEWGLSGIVWSEANLVRKLAVETAKNVDSLTPAELQELQRIARHSKGLVESMERFGWKRLNRGSGTADSTTNSSLAEGDLPDPEQVGQALADSLGLEGSDSQKPESAKAAVNGPRDRKVVSRYDTETPVGIDDPGMDDERTANRLRIDIDQFRVDDYIDETPTEARDLADAREDGVEAAIAAASPPGISGPVAGHISRREVQTRSATMAYSQDSIYDADDYDPDVDYDIDDPLTQRKMNREAAEILDGDDNISIRNPAIAAEGEDELLAAMKRGGTAELTTAGKSATAAVDRTADGGSASDNVTAVRYKVTFKKRPADADWVQLHLELNQLRWFAAKEAGLSYEAVRSADSHLNTTVKSVRQVSDSSRLQVLLKAN